MLRILLVVTVLATCTVPTAAQPCAARIGGNWFINCKSLISYQGQDVVTFTDWSDPISSVAIDVYGSDHRLEAKVRGGKLEQGSADRFLLKRTAEEFSLIDGSTDRIICILKKVASTNNHAACQVNVWLDLYVSGKGYFHCDPEKSNEPSMQYMRDSTFEGALQAIMIE